MTCRPSPVQTTGVRVRPFRAQRKTGPIPELTQGMITDNPVELTDTGSTTDNTSHHVTLSQVPLYRERHHDAETAQGEQWRNSTVPSWREVSRNNYLHTYY